MAFGAAFDAAFGLAILVASKPAAALMGLPLPADPVYLNLNGVLLLLLAGLYALCATDPERYHGIAPVSAAGRALGLALLVRTWASGGAPALLGLGLADGAIGLATVLVWLRARRHAPSS